MQVRNAERTIVALLIVISVIVVITLWYRREQKVKEERIKSEYTEAICQYERNVYSLQLLDASHKQVIEQIQEELNREKKENNKYRHNQQTYMKLNENFQNLKRDLTEENDSLKARIEELKRQITITKEANKTPSFSETNISKRISVLMKSQRIVMSEQEKAELLKAMKQYYPLFVNDLSKSKGISPLGVYVCLLVAMNIAPGYIACMLNISTQQVSNLKQEANYGLFGERSARTLYQNILKQYDLYIE